MLQLPWLLGQSTGNAADDPSVRGLVAPQSTSRIEKHSKLSRANVPAALQTGERVGAAKPMAERVVVGSQMGPQARRS